MRAQGLENLALDLLILDDLFDDEVVVGKAFVSCNRPKALASGIAGSFGDLA